MSPKASADELANAIIQNVEHSSYPESEDVISADLPPSALPKLLKSLNQTKEEVKQEVRSLSHDAGSDVDGWIAQARRVQADLERSKTIAREIVQEKETNKLHREAVDDAASKVELLKSELMFNSALAETLERTRSITSIIDSAEAEGNNGRLIEAIEKLEQAVEAAGDFSRFENARFTGLLHDRIAQLGAELSDRALSYWNGLVRIDAVGSQIVIHSQSQDDSAVKIDMLVNSLARLNALEDTATKFVKGFDRLILRPRLSSRTAPTVRVAGNSIAVTSETRDQTVSATLQDIQKIVQYLQDHLPPLFVVSIAESVVPRMTSRLIDTWLRPSIPLDLPGISNFQETLSQVSQLQRFMENLPWPGSGVLSDWIEEAPRRWLSQRKDAALATIRNDSFKMMRARKVVERVETQKLSRDDALQGKQPPTQTGRREEPQSAQTNDDWDAAWEEAEEEKPAVVEDVNRDDEEDSSAWDMDDDGDGDEMAAQPRSVSDEAAADDDGEAWGWGDDEQEQSKPVESQLRPEAAVETNGDLEASNLSERQEMTLRENYTVTGIPDSVINLILQIISDAQTLSQPDYSDSPIAGVAIGLYSIPALLVAMYRATAATYYAKDIAGNMLMYNDASRLSESLRDLLAVQEQKDRSSQLPTTKQASKRLRLDADIDLLSAFGKRAYGREMESQRTILRDLLDGAQGFTNCTVQPFARECDNAIEMTVDRIREVNGQWKDVLSPSARLQSLGNLASTAMSKIIVDVEDMTDIGEDESARLKKYCDEVTKLSDLFKQPAPDANAQEHDTVQIYTPNWFKFQYLGQILESSLVDIKYLWQEGELSLEFEVEEVVDLIKALFAASDYRRNAIAEIERSGRRNDLC